MIPKFANERAPLHRRTSEFGTLARAAHFVERQRAELHAAFKRRFGRARIGVLVEPVQFEIGR